MACLASLDGDPLRHAHLTLCFRQTPWSKVSNSASTCRSQLNVQRLEAVCQASSLSVFQSLIAVERLAIVGTACVGLRRDEAPLPRRIDWLLGIERFINYA